MRVRPPPRAPTSKRLLYVNRYILRVPTGNLVVDPTGKWAAVTSDPICSGWFTEKEAQRVLKAMLKDNQVKDVSRTLLEQAAVEIQ